jgi:hypothetical protein
MTPLILKRNETPKSYEAYLGMKGIFSREIRVPKKLASSGAFGGSLALAQFILTWSRKAKSPTISCYLTKEDSKGQTDFVSQLHGLAAVYFASKVKADDSDDTDLRRLMLSLAKDRVDAMFRGRFNETSSKGMAVEMVFIQGAQREFHGSFYKRIPTPEDLADRQRHGELIRDKAEISSFAEDSFNAIGLASKQSYLFDWPEHLLGSILAEAFRNTAEHAYLESSGKRLDRNLRCVSISRVEIPRNRIREYELSSNSATEAARSYLAATSALEKHRAEERKNVQFIEVSIFDSGTGFADTMALSPGYRVTNDCEAVAKCFSKHGTSKASNTGGEGLYRILEAVHTAGGFIRTRTSKAEAFYCAGEGFDPSMNPLEFVHECSEHVEGSLLTIGIPIKY